VQATFGSDGSAAEVVYTTGKGAVTLLGYHPGLSYFAPATPRRPVDRCCLCYHPLDSTLRPLSQGSV
jgi:hypothetical protein